MIWLRVTSFAPRSNPSSSLSHVQLSLWQNAQPSPSYWLSNSHSLQMNRQYVLFGGKLKRFASFDLYTEENPPPPICFILGSELQHCSLNLDHHPWTFRGFVWASCWAWANRLVLMHIVGWNAKNMPIIFFLVEFQIDCMPRKSSMNE